MKIDVLTLFPDMFTGPMDASIIQRARKNGLLDLRVHNLRDYTHDNYKTVDDRPFGGGPGMVLKPEPIFEALEALRGRETRVILMAPAGRTFSQDVARELAGKSGCFSFAAPMKGSMSGCAKSWWTRNCPSAIMC